MNIEPDQRNISIVFENTQLKITKNESINNKTQQNIQLYKHERYSTSVKNEDHITIMRSCIDQNQEIENDITMHLSLDEKLHN